MAVTIVWVAIGSYFMLSDIRTAVQDIKQKFEQHTVDSRYALTDIRVQLDSLPLTLGPTSTQSLYLFCYNLVARAMPNSCTTPTLRDRQPVDCKKMISQCMADVVKLQPE
jgi:hypothetical protein